MTRKEIIEKVSDNTDIPIERVSKYSNYKLFARWLHCHDIFGYTNDIIDAIETIFNIKINENED